MNDCERIIRRSERRAVTMAATCRTATGRRGDVVVTDLTSEGCCIFTKAVPLSEGVSVWIKPANFEPLPGIVRWAERGYAGIEFDRAIYAPVAEHLQKSFAALGS